MWILRCFWRSKPEHAYYTVLKNDHHRKIWQDSTTHSGYASSEPPLCEANSSCSQPLSPCQQSASRNKEDGYGCLECLHSVSNHEEDRHTTRFITPWGRYRYKVAPQDILASGDVYKQRFNAIITDFKDKVNCVDDTCMWVEPIE